MEEIIIQFKTAELLKEKGFGLLLPNYYYQEPSENFVWKLCSGSMWKYFNLHKGKIVASTQAQLQKWLRDVHNLEVEPEIYHNMDSKKRYKVRIWGENMVNKGYFTGYVSYEEALEEGLQQALKLLP